MGECIGKGVCCEACQIVREGLGASLLGARPSNEEARRAVRSVIEQAAERLRALVAGP